MAKPWVLLREIYLPQNQVRNQKDRIDIVRLVKMNRSGKVMNTKRIPKDAVRFIIKDGKRYLQIDSEFTKEFAYIETVRHYERPENFKIPENAVAA